MSDDDDDSDDDDKSTAQSSSVSTASTTKTGKAAAGGGSGLGLCLCLLGVLGVCAAGAVAAFMLLDEGGGANKTDNASEAASGPSEHSAASAASTPPSVPTTSKKAGGRADEDAPRLDAYGRFAQQEDNPLKAAVVASQRVHRKSTRRRSRVRMAHEEKQSDRNQVSQTKKRAAGATRHATGHKRRASHAVKSVVKPHGRHPTNASSPGEAEHRGTTLRTNAVESSTEAISGEVSLASGGSLTNRTRRRVFARNNATWTTYAADASSSPAGSLKNTAHVVVSTKRTETSAGNHLNVSQRAQVGEGLIATDAEGRLKRRPLKAADTGAIKTLSRRGTNSSVRQAQTRGPS